MLTVLTLKQTGEVYQYVGEMNGRQIHVSQWAYTGRIRLSEVKGYDLINTVDYGPGTSNRYVPEELSRAMKEATDAYYAE